MAAPSAAVEAAAAPVEAFGASRAERRVNDGSGGKVRAVTAAVVAAAADCGCRPRRRRWALAAAGQRVSQVSVCAVASTCAMRHRVMSGRPGRARLGGVRARVRLMLRLICVLEHGTKLRPVFTCTSNCNARQHGVYS